MASRAASEPASLRDYNTQEGKGGASSEPAKHDNAVYCPPCEMWFNGLMQYDDHLARKRHRKKVAKAAKAAAKSGASSSSQFRQ